MNLRQTCLLSVFICILNFSVKAGDSSFVVKDIRLLNLRKTKSEIVLRELTFKIGDTIKDWNYHHDLSRKQLLNLFLFNEVKLFRNSDTVYVHLVERWYLWPIPVLDYADRNLNQWLLTKDPKRLIYGVNLAWYNIRGRNETMILDVVLGYTKSLGISYRVPYINKKMSWGMQVMAKANSNREVWYSTINDKVVFFNDNDKTLIKRQMFEVMFTNRKKFLTYHNLYSGFRKISVADTILKPTVNEQYLLDGTTRQSEAYLGYQLVYDKRDFKGFPLNGHLLKFNTETSNFFKVNGGDFTTLSFKLAYSRYYKISKSIFGSYHIGARFYNNKYPQYANTQALGYLKDYIRGYELKVIDGNHFALGKVEFKYQFMNRTYRFMNSVRNYEKMPVVMYLTMFADGGSVNNNWNKIGKYPSNALPNSLLYGFGAGYNLVVYYDYCMRLEYSFDKALNNRFYLSFVTAM